MGVKGDAQRRHPLYSTGVFLIVCIFGFGFFVGFFFLFLGFLYIYTQNSYQS